MKKTAPIVVTAGALVGLVVLMVLGPLSNSNSDSRAPLTPASEGIHTRQTVAQPPSSAENAPVRLPEQTDDIESRETLPAIPTPPEFAAVPSSKVYWHHDRWRELHLRLEREPIDPTWASQSEAALNRAFNDHQEIIRHGTPTITCRTTMCQVQMLAYGAADVDEGQWSTRVGAVYKGLRSDFDIADFSVAQEGGTTAMILHLTKKQYSTLQ